MPSDWTKNRETSVISDVDSATQFGTIGRQEQAKTTAITDAGFQSYLTNVPIPRFFASSMIGTYLAASNTIATFSPVVNFYHNPFNMFVPSTGLATVPIDGYWDFFFNLACTAGANAYIQLGYTITPAPAGSFQILTPPATATTTYQGSAIQLNTPMRAGTTVSVNVGNNTAGNITVVQGMFMGCWKAPFDNYQGGN